MVGYTNATWPYKFDVAGYTRSWGMNAVTVGDVYDIKTMPGYANIYGPAIDGSVICFGAVYASIGVNKQPLGNIPAGSLIMGGASPYHYTTLVDYGYNPVFVVDGIGMATINGGYSGIGAGGTVANANSNAYNFSINGARGSGSGTAGDIVFLLVLPRLPATRSTP
jgi:hypothetical protein